MIAVVTGGSGFIGRNLVQRLLDAGYTVRCLTRPGGGAAPEGATAWPVTFDDAESLRTTGAFDGAGVVFHVAGRTRAAGQAAFDAANVEPTRNLLRALKDRRAAARFVYVSSQSAAGPALAPESPVTETDEPRPVEAYGRSKLSAERVVMGHADDTPVTVVRPCSVYGPGDRAFLALFRLARHGLILYPGIENQLISVLHVDDVVSGLVSAAESPKAVGKTFFLASERAVSWRTIGEHVATAVGRQVSHVSIPWALAWVGCLGGELVSRLTDASIMLNLSRAELARQSYWVCAASRARETFGFHESRSLPSGLRDTYLWYTQRGWLAA